MIALDPRRERDYITSADRDLPEDQQTTLRLRTLPESVMVEIMDSVRVSTNDDGDAEVSQAGVGTRTRTILRHGLTGWSNFKNGDGSDVPFEASNGAASDDSLGRIPWDAKIELANAVEATGRMTEDEVEKPEQ